ncbi:methenyltetrahydrofolate cyclohydrolase [Anaerosporomusa subterranea]|uniref:Methenyltetrahydrofolate cyclohydrolase n=1 Tax=Anaerosporomusa subterranea TaxID=1794912 RepID=A0A154BM79_ANASB|nr:cyclodeaminase/cyclohydrolase family protein [Anaerosporomusa subterranea]KYZ74950.1 methenyltetrahydrofolate cyclohydrolase [Anaerosporomusa subterranea]
MLVQQTVAGFIAELSSDSPAPGGGSVAALSGALGASLVGMVCRLTIGNAKYAAADVAMRGALVKVDELKDTLTRLIDKDTAVFNQVMAAYRLPKTTDAEKTNRSEVIQLALKEAAALPLSVAEHCLALLELSKQALVNGNANASSDAAVAGAMAHAGLAAALYNVRINAMSIKDEEFAVALQKSAKSLKSRADSMYKELEAAADVKIG